VTAYNTGIRRGELTAIQSPQLDFVGFITLEKAKPRTTTPAPCPFSNENVRDLLLAGKKEREEKWPESLWVFNRLGEPIKTLGGRGTKPVSGPVFRI
jgi:hypothetical protein